MGAASPFAIPARRAAWRPDRWGRLVCRAVWDETHDVRSFLLAPEDGARIPHEPGQFLTLYLPQAGGVERSYTISSSAAADRAVAVTVKRKPGGAASGRLHEVLQPGSVVDALGPAGRFGPATLPAEAYLLLSAGSGVTPMLSVVRTAADLGIDLDAVFLHAARSEADLIAGRELADLQRRLPRLKVMAVPTRPGALWQGPSGRLDAEALARLVPDIDRRAVLCCGPDGFMADMRVAALDLGVPPARWSEESFVFGAEAGDAAAESDAPSHRVTFARSHVSFDCRADTTILAAAREAGVAIPSSCTKGLCGTCKSLKVKGTVAMDETGTLRPREVLRGFILPCSSKPTSDVVLDR